MRAPLSLDAQHGVWTIHLQASLLQPTDLAAWRRQLVQALQPLDRRVDMLVDLAGLTLHPALAPLYAYAVAEEISPHVSQLLHYDASPGTAAALRLGYSFVRLYDDREAALAALDDIRRDRAALRRSGTVPKTTAEDLARLAVCITERKRR
jgi:hypothetical protein